MAKIKGKWRWNSTVRALNSNEEIKYSVAFTTDDSEPSSLSKSTLIIKGQGYGSYGGYNVSSGDIYDPFVGYFLKLGANIAVFTSVGTGGYLNFKEDSRIINFGQTEQEISDELFAYIQENAVYLPYPKIKGTWKWNDTVKQLSPVTSWSVSFTCPGEPSKLYTTLSVGGYIGPGLGYGYKDGTSIVYDYYTSTVNTGTSSSPVFETIVNKEFQIINFGTKEQEINDSIYAFILANATPLVTEFLIQRDTLTATADSIRKYLDKQNHYIFSSKVIYGVVPNTICAFLYECIDATEPEREGIHESHDTAKFDAVGYERNNEGIIVPVLYEFIDADLVVDKYFYIGTVSSSDMGLQGEELLDKWRKIEMIPAGEDETGFSTWESTERQYVYTTHIITTNEAATTINPLNFPDQIAEVYATGLSASGIKNANEEVY